MGVFCLDTNIYLVMARYYPSDIFPGIWNNLNELAKNKRIIAPKELYNELTKKDDNAKQWIEEYKNLIIKPFDKLQNDYVIEITARFPQLVDINSQRAQADPFLIALAMKENAIVVTEENPRSPYKIPAVCDHFDVRCKNLTDFFRHNNWKFY